MMTEANWMQCGDGEAFCADWVVLTALGDRVSARKLVLFACACIDVKSTRLRYHRLGKPSITLTSGRTHSLRSRSDG